MSVWAARLNLHPAEKPEGETSAEPCLSEMIFGKCNCKNSSYSAGIGTTETLLYRRSWWTVSSSFELATHSYLELKQGFSARLGFSLQKFHQDSSEV